MKEALLLILSAPIFSIGVLFFFRKDESFALQKKVFSFFSFLVLVVFSLFFIEFFKEPTTYFDIKLNNLFLPQFEINSLNLIFLALSSLIFTLIFLNSTQRENSFLFFSLISLSQFSVNACLLSNNLLWFYIFWELMVIPLYFLIAIWGEGKSFYAAFKFAIYTFSSGIVLFLAILYLYATLEDLSYSALLEFKITEGKERLLLLSFLLPAFVKIPIFPFHSWLLGVVKTAPKEVALIFLSVLFQMGIYLLLKFAIPMFPFAWESYSPYISLIALFSILYGAFLALRTDDIKELIVYSSISHLGFLLLGLLTFFSVSYQGVIFHIFGHGVCIFGLYLLLSFLFKKIPDLNLRNYYGLVEKFPQLSYLLFFLLLAYIALPLTTGFIGEFLILSSIFRVYPIVTLLSFPALVLTLVFSLRLYRKLIFGEVKDIKLEKPSAVLKISLLLTVFISVFLGFFPRLLLDSYGQGVGIYLDIVKERSNKLRFFNKIGDNF